MGPKIVDKDAGEGVPDIVSDEELFIPLSPGARVKYFFIRGFVSALGVCAAFAPERVTFGICTRLALFAFKREPRFRKIARDNLEIAFGKEKSPAEIDDILRRTYINYGKNMAEFLMIPHKSEEWVRNRVKFSDPGGWLDAEIKKGRGVVAVSAHSGSMELVGSWIGIMKFPMVTVVKAQRDALLSKFVMETRMKWGARMLFRAKGVRKECLKQLGLKQIVGLVGDQNAASYGVFVDYFGKKAATPTGAADMAMQTGLPVLPSFMSARNPDNTITVYVLEPIEMINSGNREADILANVQAYTAAIERFVREHPDEYLWWHRRWKTRPDGEE